MIQDLLQKLPWLLPALSTAAFTLAVWAVVRVFSWGYYIYENID